MYNIVNFKKVEKFQRPRASRNTFTCSLCVSTFRSVAVITFACLRGRSPVRNRAETGLASPTVTSELFPVSARNLCFLFVVPDFKTYTDICASFEVQGFKMKSRPDATCAEARVSPPPLPRRSRAALSPPALGVLPLEGPRGPNGVNPRRHPLHKTPACAARETLAPLDVWVFCKVTFSWTSEEEKRFTSKLSSDRTTVQLCLFLLIPSSSSKTHQA